MKPLKPQLGVNEIERLKHLFNSKESFLSFLAYEINLESIEITDRLGENNPIENREAQVLWVLLSHFSDSQPRQKAGILVNFRDLPGGYAYAGAFMCRAVQPISETFGEDPARLIEAGMALGGNARSFGEVSIEIPALPPIPLVYILWGRGEFPASANVLFDKSASCFLPTEDLAVLAEITTIRLQKADRAIR